MTKTCRAAAAAAAATPPHHDGEGFMSRRKSVHSPQHTQSMATNKHIIFTRTATNAVAENLFKVFDVLMRLMPGQGRAAGVKVPPFAPRLLRMQFPLLEVEFKNIPTTIELREEILKG